MNLYVNRYEHKELMEKLLGICPLCLVETMKADFTFVLEFYDDDDPRININELDGEEIYNGSQ